MVRKQPADIEAKKLELLTKAVDKGLPILEKHVENQGHIEGSRVRWSIIGFIGILVIVTGITGFLVYADKVDASNFTFLMGTLIGATIAILGDVIIPSE